MQLSGFDRKKTTVGSGDRKWNAKVGSIGQRLQRDGKEIDQKKKEFREPRGGSIEKLRGGRPEDLVQGLNQEGMRSGRD